MSEMPNKNEEDNSGKPMFATVNVVDYVWEKVKKSDAVIYIPKEPIYYHEDNLRTVIGLFPKFSVWATRPLESLDIVMITNKELVRTSIQTSEKELSDKISELELKGKSREDYLQDNVIRYLKDSFGDNRIPEEIFVGKYKEFSDNIMHVTELKLF